MNAEGARRHLSREPDQMPVLVDGSPALSIVSEHWFVFRGSPSGAGEYRCGCGELFLTPAALREHVQRERGTAIAVASFGTETDPSC